MADGKGYSARPWNAARHAVVAAFVVLFLASMAYAGDDYMACSSSSTAAGVELIRYYSITNAHGEKGYEKYTYRTACLLEGLRNDTGIVFLKLSNLTNAHASDNTTSYPYSLYAGYDYGYVSCSIKSGCEWYESCIISLSNSTNAHMESCSENNYPYRVCCYAVDRTVPEIWFSPPTPSSPEYTRKDYIEINVSVNDSSYLSSFINFNRSLFLYLPMDEGSGSTAYDRSGFGRNGTLNGDAAWKFGKFGKAVFFDGVDDSITTTNSVLNVTAFTVSAWVKNLSNPYPWVSIVNEYPTSLPRWALRLDRMQVANGTETVDCAHGNSTVYDGNWHFLAGVWNGTHTMIYVDGELQNICQGPSGRIAFQTDIKIGENADTGSDFHGWIDEVRVFTRALKEGEIRAMYSKDHRLFANITGLEEGSYEYYGYTIDMSGNWNETEKRVFVSDRTPPEAYIIAPPNNSVVNLTVEINTSVSDTLSPIDIVELYVDSQLNATNSTENPHFFWNTSGIANGDHYLKLRACDRAGNCGFSGTYHYIVNNTMYVNTNVTNEIDIDGTSTAVIWANATRNDGTYEDDTQVDTATVEFSTGKYNMTWNATSNRWEYVANNSVLGLPIGDNSYRINITDILNITGIRDYFIHVDDISITVYNFSSLYYSYQPFNIRVVTRRASNASLINTTVNATMYGLSGVAYSNRTDIDGDEWISMKTGCSNGDETHELRVYANSTWLDELYTNTTTVKPRPTRLECGFSPPFMEWDYSQQNITVWCRLVDELVSSPVQADSLNVSITDGSALVSHTCEGTYSISDFTWNASSQRYEMTCQLNPSNVPADCYDLSLQANATRDCYANATNATSGVIQCKPVIDAAWIEPGYIDVDHTSEVFLLKANITDYDGYSDISATGRRAGLIWSPMSLLSSYSPYSATFYTTIAHESSIVCFYGEVNASDAYQSTLATTANQGCGEDIYSTPVSGCNQTVEWGNTVEFVIRSNYSTDNTGVSGTGECFLYNSSLTPQERDSNSTSINGEWTCGITPSLVTQNTTFLLGVNASGSRPADIDEKEIFNGCWLNVTLHATTLDCTHPEAADTFSEIEINCTYSDSNGGIAGASLSITSSSLCETTMSWLDRGNGTYTYRCILEEPGLYNITVNATRTGYETAVYRGEVISRYVEREALVSLQWDNPGSLTIFNTVSKINYYSPYDLESPFACIVENSTTTGIVSLGITEYLFANSTAVAVAQKELENEFVIPFTDATCSDVNSKVKTFVKKGYVSSPFSRSLITPSKYTYYVIYESPIPIADTVRIGPGRHRVQLRVVNGTLRVTP